MSDYTLPIDLADYKRGDLWIGKTFPSPKVSLDGVSQPAVPDGVLSRVRCHFVLGTEIYKIDSDPNVSRDAPAVILDVDTWTVEFPENSDFLPTAGSWSWDLEFYKVGATAPLTLFKGEIVVHADVTVGTDTPTGTVERTSEDGTTRTTEDGTTRTQEDS